jgi:hypothetical protein
MTMIHKQTDKNQSLATYVMLLLKTGRADTEKQQVCLPGIADTLTGVSGNKNQVMRPHLPRFLTFDLHMAFSV